jgi:hypothetical protein
MHTLWPLSQGEIAARREDFIGAAFEARLPQTPVTLLSTDELVDRLTRGGYPEAYTRSGRRRGAWFESYITTILQRDIRDLARITGLADLPRLLVALAARSSQLLSFSDLSRDLQMPQTTLKRYLGLLEAALLYRIIPAWAANIGKRLVKSPKAIVNDSGLSCHLLGTDKTRLRADRSLLGRLTKSFVVAELLKQQSWSRQFVDLYHYRTHAQKEVDLVLEARDGRLTGIEVKAGAAVSSADLSGLRDLAVAAGDRFVRGIVLYLGAEIVPFGSRLHAVPLASLWEW